jgi:hypothetical protein
MPNTIDVRNFTSAAGTTTAGIQEAINALPAQGGTILIPSGLYTVSSTIKLPTDRPCWLLGEGAGSRQGGNAGATSLQWATPAATYKDMNMIEMRGDYQKLEAMALIGNAVSGKGRGVQIGRLAAVDTGDVLHDAVLVDVQIQDMPSYAVAFYGTDVTQETNENNPNTAVNGDSLTVGATLERVYSAGCRSGGIAYLGQGCTTVSLRDCQLTGNVGGPGVKLYKASGTVFHRCVIESMPLAQTYLQQTGSYGTLIEGCWFEQGVAGVPTAYMIDLTTAQGTTIVGCTFVRPASSTGVCLFLQTAADCQATVAMNPFGVLAGVNQTGDSITKHGSPFTLLGYGRISQLSGFVDMTIT